MNDSLTQIQAICQHGIAMAEKATPGPWEVGIRHAEKLNQHSFAVPIYAGQPRVGTGHGPTMEQAIANAEQHAQSRTLLPALATALQEAVAALEKRGHADWCESRLGAACSCGLDATLARISASLTAAQTP